MREDFWYISEEQCWTFFLLGLFTEHNLILGNQHKQRSPCLSAAKRTEVTACSSKSRLSLRAKHQQLLQVSSLTTVVARITNAWDGSKIHLRSDSPGKPSHFWHLLPATMSTRRYLLVQSSSCWVSSKTQVPSAFICYSCTWATHCLHKSWHPFLTVPAAFRNIAWAQPKEESEMAMLHQKMFWFRKPQSRMNLTQGRKACVSQGTAWTLKNTCSFMVCAVFQITAGRHWLRCSRGLREFPFVNSNFNTPGTSGSSQKP